jgi:hypothetical protein
MRRTEGYDQYDQICSQGGIYGGYVIRMVSGHHMLGKALQIVKGWDSE